MSNPTSPDWRVAATTNPAVSRAPQTMRSARTVTAIARVERSGWHATQPPMTEVVANTVGTQTFARRTGFQVRAASVSPAMM